MSKTRPTSSSNQLFVMAPLRCPRKWLQIAACLMASAASHHTLAQGTNVLPSHAHAVVMRHIIGDAAGAYDGTSQYGSFKIDEVLDPARVASFYAPAKAVLDQIKMVDPKLADTIDLGRVSIDPKVTAQVEALGFGWGVGHDTMVVGVVPFWHAQVALTGPGFIPSSSLAQAGKTLAKEAAQSSDPERAKILAQIINKIPQVQGANLQQILVSQYGYKPIGDWTGQGVGDLEFYAHHQWRNDWSERHGVGLANRLGLILPTGRTKDPDELTDVPFGSGITQTYAEGIIDKPLFGNFLTLSSSFRYSYSWRASRDYRLITDPNFPLSPNKESIQYKPGDRVIAKGRADVRVFGPLHGYSSYAVERRWSDQIRGNDSTYNYGVLESNTDIEIDTAEFGLTYSTVKMFQAKRFPVPFDVTASYSRVVGGRNTELVSLAFAEFSLFF